jgi:hypothetical protein
MRALSLLLCLASVPAFAKNKSEPFPIAANPEAVKKAVLAEAVAEGYRVENDSEFQLVLTKDMNKVGGVFAAGLLSPSACAGITPRYLFTVILVPNQQGTDVTAHYEMEHAGGFCRPVRTSEDKQHKKFFEEFMAKVKAASEGQQSSAAAKP